MKKYINIALIAISLFAGFSFAFAADTGGYSLPNPLGNITLTNLIKNITGWATGLLIAVSVLFIIYAAYLFLFAGGDPKNVTQAKNIITYTVVAIIVALMSKAIIDTVILLLGGTPIK